MYSLYVVCPDGRLEWICDVDDATRARTIARFSSRHGKTVSIMQKFEDGAQGLLGTFQRGDPDYVTSLAS